MTHLGITSDSSSDLLRLCSLVTDQAVLVCRKVFTSYAQKLSGSVLKHIADNRAVLQSIDKTQFDILFPNGNPVDTVDNCDLDLLACLLQKTCEEKTYDEYLSRQISALNKLRNIGNEIKQYTTCSTGGLEESKLEELLKAYVAAFIDVEQDISGLELEAENIANVRECVADLTLRLTAAESLLKKMSPQMSDNQEKMNQMIKSIDTDRDTSKDLELRVANLEGNQKRMKQMIAENITNSKNLEQRVKALENRLDDKLGQHEDIHKKMQQMIDQNKTTIDRNKEEIIKRVDVLDKLVDWLMKEKIVSGPSAPLPDGFLQ